MLRWEMAALRESPWYQEILQEGLEIGRREGLEEGLEKGLRKGRQQSLLDFLAYRFGQVPARIQTRLAARSLAELNVLFDAAMDAPDLAAFEESLIRVERGQA